MAQYSVSHTCGHTGTVQLYGPGQQREQRLRWLAGQPCPACLRRIDQERAAEHAARRGLPPLTGTEKQIAWAMTIRYHALVMIDRVLGDEDRATPIPLPEAIAFGPGETTTLAAIIADLERQDSAHWWIEHARDVQEAGRPLDLARGRGGLRETDFVADLLRRSVGITRPTARQLVDSGDPAQLLRAALRGR